MSSWIYQWTAKRSGPALTVTGKDQAGNAVKIGSVESLFVRDGRVVAVTKDNHEHKLAML